jgi:DNA modification methylase
MPAKDPGITVTSTDIRTGVDVRALPFNDEEFDGCVAHPPYWDARRYSDDPRDLSNTRTYEEFLKAMTQALNEIRRVTKMGGTLLIITGDRRKGGVLYPIHADLAVIARQTGWELLDILVLRSVLHAIKTPRYSRPGSKPPFIGHAYCLVFRKAPIQLKLAHPEVNRGEEG